MASITSGEDMGQTLVDLIIMWGERDGETPAFIFWSAAGRRELSRTQVLDLSSRFSSRLKQHGIQPGDVVCVCLPNCTERVVAEFGVQLAGAVSMNGQLLRTDGEDFVGSLEKSNCVAVVLNPDLEKGAWQICRRHIVNITRTGSDVITAFTSSSIPSLKAVFCLSDDILPKLNEEPYIHRGRREQDIATIFTTSGSTGYSKLVPHSHRDLRITALTRAKVASTGEKTLNCFQFGWVAGYPLAYLYHGAVVVKIDDRFPLPDKVDLVMATIRKEEIRHVCMPQDLFVHAVRRSVERPALLTAMFGGCPLNRATLEEVGRSVQTICFKYAITETGSICELEINKSNVGDIRDWMVGTPYSHIKVKVVDTNLEEVPSMTRGEILVQSTTLCHSYIGQAVKGSFLPGGWFRSGDVGYMRGDGCLFVEGRSSDAIMHGSYILYPSWLEQKLALCPGVAKVVIVPVPDTLLHHQICACVELDPSVTTQPTAEDILDFCKKQLVLDETCPANVIPKYVLFFTTFPHIGTNKLNRRLLSAQAKERLKLI